MPQTLSFCDLNCDLGESFGAYTMGNDEAVMPYISSANIACGFHAGDPLVMTKTIQLALQYGVGIGAHPGYPDLAGFGRRNMELSPAELHAAILYQVGALKSMTEAQGGTLRHVKPHGALYNKAAANFEVAQTIAAAVNKIDNALILVCPANSEMARAAASFGLPFALEVFADRAYNDDSTLVPRHIPGAVIHDPDELNERVIRFIKEQVVVSVSGRVIPIRADTICIHGDNEAALSFVRNLNLVFQKEGVSLKSMGT
jgi:5-oxoprolinase (ATP-hydrolysing) subunit A